MVELESWGSTGAPRRPISRLIWREWSLSRIGGARPEMHQLIWTEMKDFGGVFTRLKPATDQYASLLHVWSYWTTDDVRPCKSKENLSGWRRSALILRRRKADSYHSRVADVEGTRERRSPKGRGLLRKEGPQTYASLSRNLVLSRFTRFLNCHHRAFYKSHPTFNFGSFFNESQLAFEGLPTKVSPLSDSFRRAFVEFPESFQRAFGELSESFQRAFRELSESFRKAFGELL